MKQVAAILFGSAVRRSLVLGLCLALAVPSFAQRGGGGGGGRGGGGGGRPGAGGGGGGPRGPGIVANPYNLGPPPASAAVNSSVPGFGFGSALFPGGSTSFGSYGSPNYSTLGPLNNSFASTLGRVTGGVSPTSGFIGGNNRPGRRGGIYPVPVFVGGGYGYGYGNGYDGSPQVTIINAQPAVPSVIINQGYEPDAPARPVMRVYGEGVTNTGVNTIQIPSPSYPEGNPIQPGAISFAGSTSAGRASAPVASDDEPNVYMIALRDGTIYASYAYWTERDMLHYITPGHAHNQVSMDRVDLPLTRRLNRERNLDFSLR